MTEHVIEQKTGHKGTRKTLTSKRSVKRKRRGVTACSAEAYLASIPEGVGRYRLLLLRQLLFEHAFDLEESFEGGQLIYRKDGEGAFRLFLTSGFVWFTMRYPVDQVWPKRMMIGHLMTKRQSLRIGAKDVISEAALRTIIRESVGTWRDHRNEERVQL